MEGAAPPRAASPPSCPRVGGRRESERGKGKGKGARRRERTRGEAACLPAPSTHSPLTSPSSPSPPWQGSPLLLLPPFPIRPSPPIGPRRADPASRPPGCGPDAVPSRPDRARPPRSTHSPVNPRARARHGHVVADGAVAAAPRVAHGAARPGPAPLPAAAAGGGGGGHGRGRSPGRGDERRGGGGLGRRRRGGGRRPASLPARGAGGRDGGVSRTAQGGVPVPHQLRPHLRAALGALLRRERGALHRVRPRRPVGPATPPRHAFLPRPLRRRQAHPPRRRQPHRSLAPPPRGGAPRRPRQRLLRPALAALRPAPLLPPPLRRALPSPHHRRRAPRPSPAAAAQLHRGAHRRAAAAVALRGARRGRHAPRGPLRPVPHRLPVLRAGAPPRRARAPGAPPLAQVPGAMPAGGGAGRVLPGGALLPDAAGHGGPRRRRGVHAHARQLDRQRRGPPAHVRRGGGDAPAHRRAPGVQPHPPAHVRAQVRARLPRPAARHRRLRHLQGLTGALLLPACSARPRDQKGWARGQGKLWPCPLRSSRHLES